MWLSKDNRLDTSEYTPDWDAVMYARMEKRVRGMANYELLEWADVAGSGMAKAFSDYRREADEVSLIEIREGLMALWALTRELDLRRLAGILGGTMSDNRCVYLSNQMSEIPEHNFPWFTDVAESLRSQGLWVLSPHEIMHGGTQHFNDLFSHQDYVDADIKQMLIHCNCIALGPDWQNSEGSRRELSIALLAGWPVYKVIRSIGCVVLEYV
jgi:hypothetical protein